ncbi:TPA: hypothetical protein N3A08_000028 [Salmonella enterica subsp. salamae serovar 9,46:z4,z24:z39:z42]|nr:hypothetical protein [Salmonella enterica subsp. salamae serovar 9,46:z4,z24:z39:z42]
MPVTNNRGSSNQSSGSIQVVKGEVVYSNIRPQDKDGWLLVALEGGGTNNIHENVKLLTLGEKNGRVYYKILSDRRDLIGKTVSLKKENAVLCTHKAGPVQKSAILKVTYSGGRVDEYSRFKRGMLSQQFAIMNVNGANIKVTLNSAWPPSFSYSPIIPGTHKIMAQDYSHKVEGDTTGYRDAFPLGTIRCNDIWFPIELEGTKGNSSRYVHLGNVSHGCVTVYDVEKWNIVYNYLISHRTPGTDGTYVGKLVVVR